MMQWFWRFVPHQHQWDAWLSPLAMSLTMMPAGKLMSVTTLMDGPSLIRCRRCGAVS